MYQLPAELASDHTAVRCSILSGTDCGGSVPKSRLTMTGTPSSAVRRRLQFDVDNDDDDDEHHQKSSAESSDTVLDYLERLYNDQVARWNMDFRTLTPLKGGRWRWNRVATSPSLPAVDHVTTDVSCSTVSRNIATKKRGRKMNGKCQRWHSSSISRSLIIQHYDGCADAWYSCVKHFIFS